jgi:hypothetical protein
LRRPVPDVVGLAGSVEPSCTYRSPGRTAVVSRLYVAGAFPVDAAADHSLYPDENATAIGDLGLAARCVTGLHGAQDSRYNEVVVLLDNNRLFEAQGLGAQPCDELIFFFGEGQLIPADNTGPRRISVPRSELAPLLA